MSGREKAEALDHVAETAEHISGTAGHVSGTAEHISGTVGHISETSEHSRQTGTVKAVCVSSKKGVRKTEVPSVDLRRSYGIEGDAHAGNWHRQVSLLARESIDTMQILLKKTATGSLSSSFDDLSSSPEVLSGPDVLSGAGAVRLPELTPGAFAENIVTEGINLKILPVGTRLRVGTALLEVTQIGKECHTDCAIKKTAGRCVMPTDGIFAAVIEDGRIKAGDLITVESFL